MVSSTSGANEKNAHAQAAKKGHRRRAWTAMIKSRDQRKAVRERLMVAMLRGHQEEIGYLRTRLDYLEITIRQLSKKL